MFGNIPFSDFFCYFDILYLRNKEVADLLSYEEFFFKSSKNYRPSGLAFNYETLCRILKLKKIRLFGGFMA